MPVSRPCQSADPSTLMFSSAPSLRVSRPWEFSETLMRVSRPYGFSEPLLRLIVSSEPSAQM